MRSTLLTILLAACALLALVAPTTNGEPPSTNSCEELDAKVRDIIRDVAIPNPNPTRTEEYNGKQARLLRELESLGIDAVPSIIRNMDDRRPLPFQYIALSNERVVNAFEAMRQYSPKLVVDALAGVLNQLTGESFGYIYSGGTEAARAETVAGWRTFLTEKFYKDRPNACRW